MVTTGGQQPNSAQHEAELRCPGEKTSSYKRVKRTESVSSAAPSRSQFRTPSQPPPLSPDQLRIGCVKEPDVRCGYIRGGPPRALRHVAPVAGGAGAERGAVEAALERSQNRMGSSTTQQIHMVTTEVKQPNSPQHKAELLRAEEESQRLKWGCKWNVGRRKSALLCFVSGVLLGVIITLLFGRVLQHCELCSPCPEVSHVSHKTWVGFQGKCYYFSNNESAWNSSREHCQQLGASLATIDSKQEMEFMLRFRGPANRWIGLHRAEGDEHWTWADGSAFSNWFQVRGGGGCAYLNGDRISSSLCHLRKYFVCSRSNSTSFCRDGTRPQ
ncbi:uncharacterized protein [Excalfactoria chinensis]|uniref:uncharacterized protein n=1 Tax=Excalfactoria chinensis TaxID=46218 RepID=UPI003B3BEA15